MALGTRQRNASRHPRAAAGAVGHMLAPAATALLLASCATLKVDPLPDPIRPPRTLAAEATEGAAATAPQEEGTTITSTPGVVIQRTVAEGIADRLGEDLTGPPIAVSFHDVPLVTFINEVFAERLGMSFTLSAGLAEKTDLVTLRLTEPVPPNQLFATARRVLGDYGVNLREADGVLTFVADQEIGARDIPLLISGRALPEVPPTHRTAFQLVPMHVGRASDVARFLNQAFGGQELDIRTDIPTNTLLLRGTMEMLERAAEMIEVLDQPLLRGRHGVIIDPSFLAAADLATDLEAVLAAEGYSVGTGGQISTAVILLPLRSVNKLVAFASDAATLNHIREWARAPWMRRPRRPRWRTPCSPTRCATPRRRACRRPLKPSSWTAAPASSRASSVPPPRPEPMRTPTSAPAASSSTRTATCSSSGAPARSGRDCAP